MGDDVIDTGAGSNVVAFNSGDGNDTIMPSTGVNNTLSLGGGIKKWSLVLSRSGNDLVLNNRLSGQITFKDWYANVKNQNFSTLQIIEDPDGVYNPTTKANDKTLGNTIEEIDFRKLVDQFDKTGKTWSSWNVMSGMLAAHLAGSDSAAIGGDLAYQYGTQAMSGTYGLSAAQELLKQSGFGAQAQTFQRSFHGMGDDFRIH